MTRPLIAVTMGDPAGIGPEIITKTFADAAFMRAHAAFVVGDLARLERAIQVTRADVRLRPIERPADVRAAPGVLDVLSITDLPDDLPFGQLDPRAGRAAFEYLRRATELALAGEVHAVSTAPLNKEAMHQAGLRYPGHTEILADLTNTEHYAMMLVGKDLRVIHISTHVSLLEAVTRVRHGRELTVIRLAHQTLRRLGISSPRIAVAGLNPHAGENGLFGQEDLQEIAPAVQDARAEGIDVDGPWPGDTVFLKARRGEFDIVVVQYHDQGHIPIKLLGFDTGVNVTVGLPFFRTSVDHGTAFDIAGTGTAEATSMQAAIELATQLTTGMPTSADVTG
jgi:4-hydroxythreonine-4-phosphate dehydrogenase